MKYYVEKNFEDFEPWDQAKNTFRRIIDEGKANEAEAYLEEIAPEDGWTDGDINDLLWFESEKIYKALGMKPDDTTKHTADEIAEAWRNDKFDDYTVLRLEFDADGVEVYYIGEPDDDEEPDEEPAEQSEYLDADEIAALFGEDNCKINAETRTVETWED